MLIPELALAANIFEPSPEDKSMKVLSTIFGGLGVFGTGSDPLGEGIKLFNGAVLTIGGLLVAYTIIVGTIGTAHDGEMLGKKFSSVWVPIRTALGTALVLPVINGTYCVMQFIVGWLIVQGIGLADNVWEGFMKDGDMKFLSSNGMMSTNAREFGYNIFSSYACMAAIDQVLLDVVKDDAGITVDLINGKSRVTGDGITQKQTYGALSNGFRLESCGSMSPIQKVSINPTTGFSSFFTSDDFKMSEEASKELTKVGMDATTTLISEMKAIADDMIKNSTPVSFSKINAVIEKYQKTVNDASAAQVKLLKDFKTLSKNSTQDGWFLAGAFYTKMAWFADTVHRAASTVPDTSGPDGASFNNKTLESYFLKYMSLASGSGSSDEGKGTMSSGFGINNEEKNDESLSSYLTRWITWQPFEVDNGEHPLMEMKRMGNWLLGIVFAAWAIMIITVAKSESSLAKGLDALQGLVTATSIGSIFEMVAKIVMALTMPMILVGVTLSYILPMMPFLLWFGAVLGWLVMCIEALLAAPMWAIMHLSPHGDDMVGTGSQGYRLVLSLMLRPVLMIFGLIASFVIIQVVGQLLAEIFSGVFALGQVDSNIFIKIIGLLIISPLMYAVAMFVLIKKSFSMIHVIPDEMMNWFGGGGPQLGNFANTVGGEQGGMIAATAGLAMQGGQMANSLSGKMNAERTEQKAGANQAKQIMQGGGADASAMGSLEGLSTQGKAAFGKKMNEALTSVGGAGSPMGVQLMEKFNEESKNNPGKSPDENLKSAVSSTVESNFGPQANGFISSMSGGASSGASYNRAMGTLTGTKDKLMRNGDSGNEANEKIQGALGEALGSKSVKDSKPDSLRHNMGTAVDESMAKISTRQPGLPDANSRESSGGSQESTTSDGSEVTAKSDKGDNSTPPG
jgi:conjugal transfer/type IV secretion protein DotA/TraY